MIPKFNYYRSKKHLMNVADLPCQICYVEGRTQASHSNQAKHGKGRSLRASDEFTAALCQTCHTELDSGARLNKEQRRDLWQMAYQKTVSRLIEKNLWPVDIPLPEIKI